MPKETSGALSELALFAGAGGGILGGKLLGWRTVCAVERDQYAASVLAQRQNDGLLEAFPIWDDVQTFDGRPWRGVVDVISGGFPCQDISVAGKGAGIDGERSGMWKHMARIIVEVRPRYVFVENSPMLIHRGLARVLGDLSQMGYDSRWCIMGADDAGAPHRRKRIWIVAHSYGFDEGGESGGAVCNATSQRLSNGSTKQMGEPGTDAKFERPDWWESEPDVGRVAHGVAHRVDRLKAIGNGQVPAVAALAFEKLTAYI